jgi:hypothetical protein
MRKGTGATSMGESLLVSSRSRSDVPSLEELCALVLVLDDHPHAIRFLQFPEVVVLIFAIRRSVHSG